MAGHFKNRLHAGKQLAVALHAAASRSGALVLALPRGGVPVGFAIARALALELDILQVRKLGMPGHEEYALGAVASGGIRVVNSAANAEARCDPAALDALCHRELAEIARRERLYRGARPPLRVGGRRLILVDDGLATGSTMRAALAALAALAGGQSPARITVAVPVGPPEVCAALAAEVDELICLVQPPDFHAVSPWYREFGQTSDAEVQDLLALAWRDQARHTSGQMSRSRSP